MKKHITWLVLFVFSCLVATVAVTTSWKDFAMYREEALASQAHEATIETEDMMQTDGAIQTETIVQTESTIQAVTTDGAETVLCGVSQESKNMYQEPWLPDVVGEYADRYGTVVVVDLVNQHVYCCVDGEVIADADCVSGDSLSSPTPTGLYSVWCKRSDFYMQGRYYTAYATFFNNDIAIHDADAWRSEYGGTIYQWSGSHGCINTPRWFAETVYNNSSIGTPVYVF